MKVEVERTDDHFQFEVKAEGQAIPVMASPELSAEGSIGFRPMQLLLSSLATCLAIDVLNILYKKRKKVDSFRIKVDSKRSGGTPSVFTHIDLLFQIEGDLKAGQIQKAIDMGLEQYCSVYHSLSKDIVVNCKFTLNDAQ